MVSLSNHDPMINRFISADTIVPNPADPQSFNRYSYCLNNPLKYTDPSGHEVYINDYNVTTMYDIISSYWYYTDISQELVNAFTSPLFQAYNTLRGTALELTGYVENAKEKINIDWKYMNPNPDGSIPGGYYSPGKNGGSVYLNSAKQGVGSNELACLIGHELFHATIWIGLGLGDTKNNFAANEIFAYSLEYRIGLRLNVERGGYAKEFGDVHPWIPKCGLDYRIPRGAQFMYDTSLNYMVPPGLLTGSKPLPSWHKSDKTGDKFLTIAKSVWCP